VIVAAEMLVGGTGIGYFVWNEWNNLDLANVIFAILVIGVVGMALDVANRRLQKLVTTSTSMAFLEVRLVEDLPGEGRPAGTGVRRRRLRD